MSRMNVFKTFLNCFLKFNFSVFFELIILLINFLTDAPVLLLPLYLSSLFRYYTLQQDVQIDLEEIDRQTYANFLHQLVS